MDEGVVVPCDEKWCEFILGQLIDNAVRYRCDPARDGRSPCISFRGRVEGAGTAEGRVVLEVRDNGCGISAADERLDDELDRSMTDDLGFSVLTITALRIVHDSVSTRGLVTYLAIYIGFVLVVACAAILAIQQLSAASDAIPSYRTLGELGCPERLVYGSLRTQTVTAFLLPLVVGLAHSACALQVVNKGLGQYGLVSAAASSALAVVIFVIVYGGYLAFTYHTAKGLVRSGLRAARHAL